MESASDEPIAKKPKVDTNCSNTNTASTTAVVTEDNKNDVVEDVREDPTKEEQVNKQDGSEEISRERKRKSVEQDEVEDQQSDKKVEKTEQKDKSVPENAAVSEQDVGIRCYISTGFSPIPGILKQRFSDFVVNEIGTNGEIVKLTSTEVPQDLKTKKGGAVEEKPAEVEIQEAEASAQPIIEESTPISADDIKAVQAILDGTTEKKSVIVLAPDEKAERKAIHVFVKSRFPGICSNVVEEGGVKYIEFAKFTSKSDRRRESNAWPKDRPQQLHFVLYKEFKDTMEALDIISKYTNMRAQNFQFAGTKDKRAKTSQLVTVNRTTAEKIAGVNKRLRGMAVGNFQYKHERLALGQLKGNHFKIVLRGTHTTADNLQKATDALKADGFINYFGMQRFGTSSIPTYAIGKLILKGDMMGAIDLIMSPRGSDRPGVDNTRRLWTEKRDATAALEKLPKSLNIERRLMQGIERCGKEKLYAAMENIPRPTRLLYLHSYQSLLWNRLATKRIEKYGLEPIVGDLVYVQTKQQKDKISTETTSDTTEEVEHTESLTNKSAVTHITQSDIEKYTIYDVLLPLPGYSIQLPENEIKDWTLSMLAEDNLTMEVLRTKNKEYRLPGSYRHLLVRPTNVSSSVNYYNDVTEELVLADLDILNNKVLELKTSGDHQAVVLEFSLPSSAYATMLLREVMRTDTSANHQTTLNVT